MHPVMKRGYSLEIIRPFVFQINFTFPFSNILTILFLVTMTDDQLPTEKG